MSRGDVVTVSEQIGAPRVSGDEPVPGIIPARLDECSPRERG